jgi:hypothetical protein
VPSDSKGIFLGGLFVLERHVPRDKLYPILTQVRGEVDGNASFIATIDRMRERPRDRNDEDAFGTGCQ